jgi:hypothetical protein
MRPTAVPPATEHPASAEDDPAGRLLGVWRLTSCRARLSGETAPRDLFGPDPFGYIIFTPERRMMAFISRRDRRPPGGRRRGRCFAPVNARLYGPLPGGGRQGGRLRRWRLE